MIHVRNGFPSAERDTLIPRVVEANPLRKYVVRAGEVPAPAHHKWVRRYPDYTTVPVEPYGAEFYSTSSASRANQRISRQTRAPRPRKRYGAGDAATHKLTELDGTAVRLGAYHPTRTHNYMVEMSGAAHPYNVYAECMSPLSEWRQEFGDAQCDQWLREASERAAEAPQTTVPPSPYPPYKHNTPASDAAARLFFFN